MLNPGSMATSCLGHVLTLLLAETNTDVLPPQSTGNILIFFFVCDDLRNILVTNILL